VSAVLTAQEPSAKYLVNLQPPLVRHFDLIAQAPGGVARLRELILTLAVQGKLVPQDPSDEPASELLKKIRAEKDRLIAEGKIKRDKPLAEIADEEKPFELPEGWIWTSLAAVGIINPRNDAADETVASFVQMSSIPVQFSEAHAEELRPWNAIKSGFTHFAEGDVGVAKITPCFENGKSTVFRNLSNGIGAGTTELHIVRPLGGIDPRYVLLFLKTPTFLKEGEAVMTGSAGQKRLPRSYFENKPFSLPPLIEQSRIVTRVEELMQLCDALEASGQLEAQQHAQLVNTLLGTLTQSETPEALADNWQRIATHFDVLLDRPEAVDALEQTILQLAVRGLLVPQDPTDEPASVLLQKIRTEKDHLIAQGKIKRDKPLPPITDEEKPFELPQGWALARFGDLAQISSGVTLGRKTPISKPLLLPYLRVANVQRWTLKLESMKEVIIDEKELDRFQICSGDLLITEGGDWDKVGRTAIWQDQLPTCLHQNHVFKARGVTAEWCPAWAELYLNSDIARSYFAASAKQTTNLASINMTELKNCVFPLPTSFEQSRIITRVNELRSLCSSLRNHLASGQAVKLSLADALI
jgi:type I restriction enzyme S subunit